MKRGLQADCDPLFDFFCRKICRYDFLPYICTRNGGLAQLARALAWHARGHRFDPGILHKGRLLYGDRLFLLVGRGSRLGIAWAQLGVALTMC